jgi:N-acetyl sugar amidotransferase
MDTTDPDIKFNEDGICNYCLEIQAEYGRLKKITSEDEKKYLDSLATKIKKETANDEYNCLIGISGGVDSSYVAYLVSKMDLNPLVVHFDNGWNSELSVQNINNIVNKLNFDLYTYVINWEEFKDLQRAFLKASVIDIEMLTDHAITAAMFKIAKQHKIKYVFSGVNKATEYGMPASWVWAKSDLINIRAIHNKFGERKLKTFPVYGFTKFLLHRFKSPFKVIMPLNNIRYCKNDAMRILTKELNWQYYGGKHYESVFTKFYQAHILPTKFGVDKRKAHLSALIRNGEISRDEALTELAQPLYDPKELNNDFDYVVKKLNFTESEFKNILRQKPIPHDCYRSDKFFRELVIKTYHILCKRK